MHHNSQFTFKTDLPLSVLAQRLSFRFFSKGHHSSKIRLGANVTEMNLSNLSDSSSEGFGSFSSFMVVVDVSKSTTCLHFLALIYSKYDIVERFPHTYVTLNNSFSNIIIPSQRLVTMSASLRTQTVLHCLII